MINVFNAVNEDGNQLCTFKNIPGNRNQGRSYEIQILCDTENKTWELLTDIKLLDFMSVAEYIHAKGLTYLTICKWARKYNISNPSCSHHILYICVPILQTTPSQRSRISFSAIYCMTIFYLFRTYSSTIYSPPPAPIPPKGGNTNFCTKDAAFAFLWDRRPPYADPPPPPQPVPCRGSLPTSWTQRE